MKKNHIFPFIPGSWEGEGQIEFNLGLEPIPFATRWVINTDGPVIVAHQIIDLDYGADQVENRWTFEDVLDESYRISLDNNVFGCITGTGIIDKERVAWELRSDPEIVEGIESYLLCPDGAYTFRAEYQSPDQIRTTITGEIRPAIPMEE